MLRPNGSWFDRFSRHSWDSFRGGGATIATAAFMLGLALAPRGFGVELPLLIVIGLPAAFWVAVMVNGSRVKRDGKSRSDSTKD
jgi:hypothetical protein